MILTLWFATVVVVRDGDWPGMEVIRSTEACEFVPRTFFVSWNGVMTLVSNFTMLYAAFSFEYGLVSGVYRLAASICGAERRNRSSWRSPARECRLALAKSDIRVSSGG